jgi:YD repeat-containing protein
MEYEYDGNVSSIKETQHNADRLEDDWEVDILHYDDGSINLRVTFLNAGKGNRTKETIYDDDGSIYSNSVHEYEYDDNGNRIKATTYNPDGSINSWFEYEYDDSGNMSKLTYYTGDGSIQDWVEYKYVW